MDYEKAYKEAIKRAKAIIEVAEKEEEVYKSAITIFPELKESEDEKIRKELIKHLKDGVEGYMPAGDSEDYTRWLAWLEKQGSEPNWCHHKVDLSNCSEEYRKAYYDGWNNCNQQHSQCKSEENDVVKCLINGMKFYYEGNEEATWGTEKFPMKVRDILSWLEKQGEQKSILNVPPREVILSIWDLGNEWKELTNGCISTEYGTQLDYIQKHWQESTYYLTVKQGEQKPIIEMKSAEESLGISSEEYNDIVNDCLYGESNSSDKEEPKFNIDDWITNGDYTWKIVEVKPLDYILQSQDGNIVDDTISHVDEQFHLWTINDAKDGDVLADDDNNIFIFDGTVEKGKYPFAYCGLTAQGFDSYDIRLPFTHDNNIHPATWEQRNLLFKKMKEAGYEWDSEKKEQKEIDPKPYGQRKECLDCQFNYVGECKGSCQMKRDEQKPNLYFKAKDWYVSKVDGKIHNIYNSVDKVEPKFHEGDIIQFNGFGHNRYTIKNVCGLSHYINTIGEKMDMSYTDANFEVIENSDKNKLCRAWSEEDDYNVQCLVAKANCDIQKGNVGRNEELIDWLKSLRNRVKSQPDMVEALRTEYEKGRADVISEMKSSWSEEDETNSCHLKTLFENLAKDIKHEFRIISDNDRDKYTAWLKSLKQKIGE